MNPLGQMLILRARVKTGLIPNYHRLGKRIAGGNLPQKIPAQFRFMPSVGLDFSRDFLGNRDGAETGK